MQRIRNWIKGCRQILSIIQIMSLLWFYKKRLKAFRQDICAGKSTWKSYAESTDAVPQSCKLWACKRGSHKDRKNRHLSKAVASQKFYEFRTKLEEKCIELGIELRIVDRWYPSSKLCHECGCIKSDLKLSDRVYKCECGYYADRDFNASLNLRDAKSYKTA